MLFNNHYYIQDLRYVANLNLPWEDLKDKAVLITGATGMIGSFLSDVLMYRNLYYKNDILIYTIGRYEESAKKRFSSYYYHKLFQFLQQDINKPLCIPNDIKYIIHAASNAYPQAISEDPVGTMLTNIIGINNLLEYAREQRIKRILFVSSGEVYGEGTGASFTEDYSGYIDYSNPRSSYPVSKRAAEVLSICYTKQYEVDTVIVRPCHTFGATATPNDTRASSQFVRDVLNGNDITMKSEGKQIRSYCYVADCVSGLLTVLFKGKRGQVYNIANDESCVSIREMAGIIATITTKNVIFDMPDDKELASYNPVQKSILNGDKLKLLGWKPYFNFYDGMKQTIKVLQENDQPLYTKNVKK